MKEWLSAAEIASLRLPGLPVNKRNVNVWAQRCGWTERTDLARERDGRGGGLEYHFHLLPADARAAYVARHVAAIEVPVSIAREAAREDAAAAIAGPATEARDARLALLSLADRYASEAQLSRRVADQAFADQYNAGAIDAASWIRKAVRSLTGRTIRRWRALAKDGRTATLAVDRAAARRGTAILDTAEDGAVRTYLLALLAKQPQLTAHHLRGLLCDRFPDGILHRGARVPVPGVRTLQDGLKRLRNVYRNELLRRRDPDGYKSRVRFAAQVARPADHLNAVWQIDASPADVMTTDGRHSIYLAIDIYSRRLTGLVSKTARASAVGLLLRKAILNFGVPDRIKTDNGSDFTARETTRLLAALGVEHELSAPFSPEQKGHIERAIGTMQRGLMRTLAGFIGHSVADRKAIEARKSFAARLGEAADDLLQVSLSAAELQRHIDTWCADIYGKAPHDGLKGQTPFAIAAFAAGRVRRIADERALDMLLMPAAGKDGMRTVTKSGIRIDGSFYMAGFLTVGDAVHVRMDPADLGRAHVYAPDQARYLGCAICPDLAGIDPAAAIRSVRAEQKRIEDAKLAEARKLRIKAKDIAPALHRQALAAAGTLVAFPRAAETHDTPQLEAARDAALRDDETPAAVAPEILALQAELLREPAATATVTPPHSDGFQHWRRALALEQALADGRILSTDEQAWLDGYRSGPEYRGFRLTFGTPDDTNGAEANAARGH